MNGIQLQHPRRDFTDYAAIEAARQERDITNALESQRREILITKAQRVLDEANYPCHDSAP